MNSITLSFCIATRNRGAFIGATLESIICQATEQVEIVILDGASTDNTEEVVRGYQRRFPKLRYFRREVNRGVDRDFAKAVELAQGEYCWLFTDDDILKRGAIRTVLNATENSYGLVIVNAEVRNADLSKVLEPRRLQMSADRTYKATENRLMFADVANYLSFIGGVVIRRQLWSAREKEPYFGTLFIHFGVIFQSPLPEDTLVIAEPLISIRYGNAMWNPRRFEIWMFLWPELIWSFNHYSDSAKSKVCPKEPWRRTRALLLHRAIGAYSLKEYSDWLKPRLNSPWDRLAAKLIAYFPGHIANLLGLVYYFTFYRAAGMQLMDLVNSPFYLGSCRKQRPWGNVHEGTVS